MQKIGMNCIEVVCLNSI